MKKRDGALEPILLTLKIPELLCKRGVEVALDANRGTLIKNPADQSASLLEARIFFDPCNPSGSFHDLCLDVNTTKSPSFAPS